MRYHVCEEAAWAAGVQRSVHNPRTRTLDRRTSGGAARAVIDAGLCRRLMEATTAAPPPAPTPPPAPPAASPAPPALPPGRLRRLGTSPSPAPATASGPTGGEAAAGGDAGGKLEVQVATDPGAGPGADTPGPSWVSGGPWEGALVRRRTSFCSELERGEAGEGEGMLTVLGLGRGSGPGEDCVLRGGMPAPGPGLACPSAGTGGAAEGPAGSQADVGVLVSAWDAYAGPLAGAEYGVSYGTGEGDGRTSRVRWYGSPCPAPAAPAQASTPTNPGVVCTAISTWTVSCAAAARALMRLAPTAGAPPLLLLLGSAAGLPSALRVGMPDAPRRPAAPGPPVPRGLSTPLALVLWAPRDSCLLLAALDGGLRPNPWPAGPAVPGPLMLQPPPPPPGEMRPP